MRAVFATVLSVFLGVQVGCGLISGGMPGDRGPSPSQFAVSREVEPQWQGWRDDSVPHLRLRLWLIDAAEAAHIGNTYDPAVKLLVLEGDLRDGLAPGFVPADSGGLHGSYSYGLLIQRDDDEGRPGKQVHCVLFEGAYGILPVGQQHYCIFYGDRGPGPMLWSEADGFRDAGVDHVRGRAAMAIIPGQAIVARTSEGLVALDWNGRPLAYSGWEAGLDPRAIYPVLDDTAVLITHGRRKEAPMLEEGAYLWRPGDGPHRVLSQNSGWVEGPGNAYFGFDSSRDRIYRLEWQDGQDPAARRVLNVRGLNRTASAMSPDGRFVISGDPAFKGGRNDPRVDEVHEDGRRLWRRVGTPRMHSAVRPVWLHHRFGAPGSVQIVPKPE